MKWVYKWHLSTQQSITYIPVFLGPSMMSTRHEEERWVNTTPLWLAKRCIHPRQAFAAPLLLHFVHTRVDLPLYDRGLHRATADWILIALNLGVLPVGRLQLLQETKAAKNSGLSSLASGIVHDFLRPGREPLWSYGQCGTIVTPQIFIPRCLIFLLWYWT